MLRSLRGTYTARSPSGADAVLVYNLEAAVDELSARPPPEDLGAIRELTVSGLDRTADHLRRVAEELESHRDAAAKVVRGGLEEGWGRLQLRLAQEGAIRGEVTDALTDLVRTAIGTAALLQQGGQKATSFAAAIVSVAAARAQRLVRRGRYLIGIETAAAGSRQRAVQVISQIDSGATDLPFVYRRLFSTRSITDPSLLAGREGDLEVLGSLWTDWKQGRTAALLLTGSFGGTLSSLLHAFQVVVGDSGQMVRIRLEDRILDEAALAQRLAIGLGLEAEGLQGLDELAERMRTHPPDATVVAVERLEHSFMRTAAGSKLVGQALEFFSRADTLVFWVLTASAEAWEIMRRVEPSAERLVETHAVGPLSAPDLEHCIMVRHQRSGLPLSFVPGDSAPSSVTRALASAKDPGEEQTILREAFFSRLFDLTEGSVPLALLYWLRSTDFDPAAESIEVSMPEPLDFGFLEALSWDQVFTLAAFMEHATLSVEEHAAIFGSFEEDSFQVLESLGNLLLIEPVGEDRRVGEQLKFRSIEASERYRIRAVFVSIIRRVLRGRNLVD